MNDNSIPPEDRRIEEIKRSLTKLTDRLDQFEFKLKRLETQFPALFHEEEAAPLQPPPPPLPLQEPLKKLKEAPAETTDAPAEEMTPSAPTEEADEPAPETVTKPLTKTAPVGKEREKKKSIEQQLGTQWMLIAGVVLLLLGGGFFFQYAMKQGWINPQVRCIMGAVGGLFLAALGEWSHRRNFRALAAGLMGVGIVWLYYTCWAASPNGPYYPEYKILSTQIAFAFMCAVTVLAVALSIRIDIQAGGIIALIGAFLTPLLLSSGRNEQVILMSYMLVVDGGFLLLALWKRWQALVPLSAVLTSVLFLLWYDKYYESAFAFRTDAFAWAFLALFLTSTVTSTKLNRGHTGVMQTTAACASGLAGLLFLDQELSAGAFQGQLTVLIVLLLAVSLCANWRNVSLPSIGVSIILFLAWIHHLYTSEAFLCTNRMGWVLASVFLVYAASARSMKRISKETAMAVTMETGIFFAVLMTVLNLTDASLFGQLLLFDALFVALCLRYKWHWLRVAMLAWTVVVLFLQWLYVPETGRYLNHFLKNFEFPEHGTKGTGVIWAAWIWGFYALTIFDVLIRSVRSKAKTSERSDAVVAALATALLYTFTWRLLDRDYTDWMGAYTAVLGAAAIAASLLLKHRTGRVQVSESYLIQGLVLVTLAVPIQFGNATVTIAWALQGIVVMVLAKMLRHILLFFKSPIVLGLALLHFLYVDLREDERMAQEAFKAFDVSISWGLLMAAGLAVSFLATAAIALSGKAIIDGKGKRFRIGDTALVILPSTEPVIACVLIFEGMILYLFRTALELPPIAATWWWLVLGAVTCSLSLLYREKRLLFPAVGGLLLPAFKFLFYDTLGREPMEPYQAEWIILNSRFLGGLALSALLFGYIFLRNKQPPSSPESKTEHFLHTFLLLLGIILFIWTTSYEINLYFNISETAFDDPLLAEEMALSLWWGLCAVALLVIGIMKARISVRYFAIILLVITTTKVFVIDMKGVEAVYRILSFIGLGALLLFGSLLYYRFFQDTSPGGSDKEKKE